MSSLGDTNVTLVVPPITAASILTAVNASKTALDSTISGSYTGVAFNDSRGMAIIGYIKA